MTQERPKLLPDDPGRKPIAGKKSAREMR